MARKIIAYFLLSAGVLGALFFKGNVEAIVPYPMVFFIISNIIWVAGLVLLCSMPSRKQMKEQKSRKELVEYFKKTGETITINLSDCVILEHHYIAEHESMPLFDDIAFSDLERFMPDDDNVIRDQTSKMKLDNVTQSVLVYEHEIAGAKLRFTSHAINKDKATLMFLLDAQKQTTIQYDKNNPGKCYFDLDFLDKC